MKIPNVIARSTATKQSDSKCEIASPSARNDRGSYGEPHPLCPLPLGERSKGISEGEGELIKRGCAPLRRPAWGAEGQINGLSK